MWSDFRGFLTFLEDNGELLRLEKDVDPKFEVAAYIRKSLDVNGPAFLFERVKAFPDWRYAAAVYGTSKRTALGLGCQNESEILSKFMNGVRNPIPPVIRTDGQCKEVVMKGEDVDLRKIPLAWHSEYDASSYITSAVEIVKDPETGTRLLGIHRLQLRGKDTLAFWGPAEKRIGRAFLKAQERNMPLEIAITIGNEPAVDLGSQAKVLHDVDKMAVAGGIKQSPIELVQCETIDVQVPTGNEVVIEGRLLPNSGEVEGPFGEVTGVYSGTTISPTIKVTAITMRKDPIMHTVLTGFPPTENEYMLTPAALESIYRTAMLACPEVVAVNISGVASKSAYISIKKRHEGEPFNIISAVLGAQYAVKYCWIFDDDIDIYNRIDVEWAFQTRMQPHKNLHVFPVMVGSVLDPSAPIPRHSSKLGFDCTIPLLADKSKYAKVRVPRMDNITW